MKLLKYTLTILLIASLSSCVAPKYIPSSITELKHENLDQTVIKYIPLQDNDLRNSPILTNTYSYLKEKKYNKLQRYLHALEKKGNRSSDLYLAESFLQISRREYEEALQSMQKIRDTSFPLVRKLLTIDLNYEIARINGNVNFTTYLSEYQQLIDSYPENDILKKIVSLRLRYLRYND